MPNKIAVLIAYFGPLPNYLPLWLRSCEHNPTIDFLILTDQKLNDLPSNVTFIKMTLQQMKDRASKVLGFEAALSRPYKCCDYRPLYGLIFSDLLAPYDYWGHSDVDMIFGDLQKFFDEYDLYSYDKFGAWGHLSLFRNCDRVNNAFKLADYRAVYTSEENKMFDEGGIYFVMKNQGYKLFSKRIFADISARFHRYRMIEASILNPQTINYPHQTFYWENGKIYHIYLKDDNIHQEEYLYIHFQKRPNYKIDDAVMHSAAYFITNQGFIPASPQTLTPQAFHTLNKYPGKLYEYLECRLRWLILSKPQLTFHGRRACRGAREKQPEKLTISSP